MINHIDKLDRIQEKIELGTDKQQSECFNEVYSSESDSLSDSESSESTVDSESALFWHSSPQPHKSVQGMPCAKHKQLCLSHEVFLQPQETNCKTSSGAGGKSIHSIESFPSLTFHP